MNSHGAAGVGPIGTSRIAITCSPAAHRALRITEEARSGLHGAALQALRNVWGVGAAGMSVPRTSHDAASASTTGIMQTGQNRQSSRPGIVQVRHRMVTSLRPEGPNNQ